LNFTFSDLLTVQFSQAIITPSVNTSTLNSAIKLALSGPSGSITGVTWNIDSINATLLVAEVIVNYSTSTSGRGGLEQLVLTFLDQTMF
jgi:hypothetical protein